MAVAECSVAECSTPARKRGWCGRHYAMWHRTGDPATPPRWTVAPRGGACVVCDVPNLMDGSRRYCSRRCQMRASRANRAHPKSADRVAACVLCGVAIDLLVVGRGGRKRRADTLTCSRCRLRRTYRHKFPVRVLAVRDGDACGICGAVVNLELRYPDPLSPSVDHVVPRADGGTDDPANLQLAHLRCNHVKHARSHWKAA